MSEDPGRDDTFGHDDAARHERVRAAFSTFRTDACPLPPTPVGRLPWVRARARRRCRSVLVSGLAVAVLAVGANAVVDGARHPGGSARIVPAGGPAAPPAPVAPPSPLPCADQGYYSTAVGHDTAALAVSDALHDRLLTAADLGWATAAPQAVSSAGGFPGTPDSAAYAAAGASSATAAGDGGDWDLSQTVVRMVPGAGAGAYAAAAALLTCTSPEHQVVVLTAGAQPTPWVGVKETTTVSDDGGTQVQWVVYARSQDLLTQLTVSFWGQQEAMDDAHLSGAWLQELAIAATTRLAGQAPTAPVGPPRTGG